MFPSDRLRGRDSRGLRARCLSVRALGWTITAIAGGLFLTATLSAEPPEWSSGRERSSAAGRGPQPVTLLLPEADDAQNASRLLPQRPSNAGGPQNAPVIQPATGTRLAGPPHSFVPGSVRQ